MANGQGRELKNRYMTFKELVKDLVRYQYDRKIFDNANSVVYVYEICYYVELFNGMFERVEYNQTRGNHEN